MFMLSLLRINAKIRRQFLGVQVKTGLLCFLLFMLGQSVFAQGVFTHPGISHKKSDLERMKYMVAAGIEPWKTSFKNLSTSLYASYNYTVRGNASTTQLITTTAVTGYNYDSFKFDGLAAYYNAIMWSVTGDVRHAQKAVEIFNVWSNLTGIRTGGTKSLDAGRVIWKMLEGAEIIKSTYTGWNQVDIDKFKAMLVYPGYSTTVEPTAAINNNQATFYWYMYNGDSGRHGNQGIFGMRGILAMGIFLDNKIMYDRAIRYLKGQPHRADDLPYPSGPPINGTTPTSASNEYQTVYSLNSIGTTTPDYGYNEVIQHYVYENGQCQESARDQGHALLGVANLLTISEMAWNQGDDLYSFLDNRLLLGMEYAYRYNASLNYSFPDQPSPWEPTVASGEFISKKDRTGRWLGLKINPWTESDLTRRLRGIGFKFDTAPIGEMILGHYRDRMSLTTDKYKWTQRAFDISTQELGVEGQGFEVDYPGWGGLTFHRPNLCAGDPVSFVNGTPVFAMNNLPGVIEAENFDYVPVNGQNKTYSDASTTNTGTAYRTTEAVDIENCSEGGYNLTSLENGEWINYTVGVPKTGVYKLSMRYASLIAGGKIVVEFNGNNKTGEVTIPFGATNSTGSQDWQELALSTSFTLNAGVQSMRVKILGESNAFQINSFSVAYVSDILPQTITFPSLPTKLVGTSDFSPNATASSSLPITYTSSNTAVATIVNNQIHLLGAGTTIITASQAGNDTYLPATSISKTLAVASIAAGDYVSTGTMNWNGGTWNISDGNGGYTGTTTTAPTTGKNVYILAGHTVTLATTAGVCKNLTVQAGGTLLETIGLTISGTMIMDGTMSHSVAVVANSDVVIGGTWTANNNLTVAKNYTITSTGTYKGTTTAGGSVVSLTVNGTDALILIDGTLGATTTKTTGESIRLYPGGAGTTTITGTGKVNIARFQPTGNATQHIIIDMDMNLGNNTTSTSGTNTFSLLGGTAEKKLTINAGKTVSLTHPNASFHAPTNATDVNSNTALALGGVGNYGNMIYNINGTLDVSLSPFVLYTNVNTATQTASQVITVNVGNTGVLKLGANVRMAKSTSTQNIYINVADGGMIDGSSVALNTTTAPVSSNIHSSNGTSVVWFTLSPNAVYKRLVSANVATPYWIGTSNTNYNPVTINPTTGSVIAVSLQNGISPTGLLDTTLSKAINRTWNINPVVASASTLTFGYNTQDANTLANPSGNMKLLHYNTTTASWEALGTEITPTTGQGTNYAVSYTGVTNTSSFALSNIFTIPVSITNLDEAYCSTAIPITLEGSPAGGTFSVDGINTNVFSPAILANGNHAVTYIYSDGISKTTKLVSIIKPTKPTLSTDITVCKGSSTTLSASNCEETVTWSTGQTGESIVVSPTVTTSYTTTCSIGACTSTQSSPVTVTVLDATTPTTSENLSINEGDTVTLTTTGCTGVVNWMDAITHNAVSMPISPNNTTTYQAACQVTSNGVTCTSANSAIVTVVVRKNQQITFNTLNPKTIGDMDFDAGATSSAGLAITYASSNTAVATIVNGKVHLVGAGTSVITASQSGNELYNSASEVSQTLTVIHPTVVKVKYQNADNGVNNNIVRPYLMLYNEGNVAVPYNELTIRYWFTPENYTGINAWIDYAQLGNNNVKMKYVPIASPRNGALGYIEFSFEASAGLLASNTNSGVIQTRFANTDWSNLNEVDDYSYTVPVNGNTFSYNDHVTVYRNGQLIYGIEPNVTANITAVNVYLDSKSNVNSNTISTYLKVDNVGNTPLNYENLKVRYWFTKEGTASLNYYLDYAKIGGANLNSQFVTISPLRTGANTYIELGMKPSLGVLYPLSTTDNIQYRIAKTDWSNFNQADDYSYTTDNKMSLTNKVTVYYQGQLIYGIEPTPINAAKMALEEEALHFEITVLGNPITDNQCRFSVKGADNEPLLITLLTSTGNTLLIKDIVTYHPNESLSIPFDNYEAGMYLLKVSTAKQATVIKVIK